MKSLICAISVFSVLFVACGQTPDEKLISGIKSGNREMLRQALKDGADCNLSDSAGMTVLMMAITFGQTENVRDLLEKGADVNREDASGNTALIIAAVNHRNEIVRMLLQKGADINAKNKRGNTCLTAALNKRLPDTAKIIMGSGAPFAFNSSLAGSAMRCGNEEVLMMIKEKSVHGPKDEKVIDRLLDKIRENKIKKANAGKMPPPKAYEKYLANPFVWASPLFLAAFFCIGVIIAKKTFLKGGKKN